MVPDLAPPARSSVYYGDEKARQMGRSILPSTGRKAARWYRRAAHHKARSGERAEIRRLLREWPDPDECVFDSDVEGHRRREISMMVGRRRGADKVWPVIHWAEAKTRELPRDDRLSWVQSFLPDNLIGWHAITHLQGREHFLTEGEIEVLENRRARRSAPPAPPLDREALLNQVAEDGTALALLNLVLTRRHHTHTWKRWDPEQPITKVDPKTGETFVWGRGGFVEVTLGPRSPRLLKGVGDVGKFIQDINSAHGWGRGRSTHGRRVCRVTLLDREGREVGVRTVGREDGWQPIGDRHPEWRHTVDSFLREWVKVRGDTSKLDLLLIGDDPYGWYRY